jgi:hypothetical protein
MVSSEELIGATEYLRISEYPSGTFDPWPVTDTLSRNVGKQLPHDAA